jgi:crotonobetainyl-CoA:carnitine CoA-transferase CaiB-like acyl-CoA transferase
MGFPDPTIAAMAAARVAGALNERLATGRGTFIDLSQAESTAVFTGDLLAAWQQADQDVRTWRLGWEHGTQVLRLDANQYAVVTATEGAGNLDGLDVGALRAAGIAAAPDNAAPDVLESAELVDFWVDFEHPDVGRYRYDGNPYVLNGERLPATLFPSLGQNNSDVLQHWLGFSAAQCDELKSSGVLVTEPRPPYQATSPNPG